MTNAEIEEVNRIIEAKESILKHNAEGHLKDIARELSPTYAQYLFSLDSPADETLCEIYKAMLHNVFKILRKNGIDATE